MVVVCFHCNNHLGDCLFSLKFIYNIRNILKENNICINFFYSEYVKKGYIIEIEQYAIPQIIELFPLQYKPADSIELWMGKGIDGVSHLQWSVYFEKYYIKILTHLGLNKLNIDCSLWQPDYYLLDIYKSLPEKYNNIDILIINSYGCSGQLDYAMDESIDNMCRSLNKSFNIVTTRKVDDIKCTLDDKLNIQCIGAISTHTKFVIAVQTGPTSALYNKLTQASVKKWFILASDGFIHIHNDIDIDYICDGDLSLVYKYFSQINNSVCDYPKLNDSLIDDWIFYPSVDHSGDDITYIGQKPINELLNIATSTPSCISFNTLGFLKSSVTLPLKPSKYFSKTDGTYIKKSIFQPK